MNLKALLHWSSQEHHTLPWRKSRSLYKTLVSEIMLQQTTVGTVKNHFERFLIKFPDLKSLAMASEEELLVAWKGLGYYRRARSLKKIAETLHRDHKGEFPKSADVLQEISGIGPYTANALLSIGMNEPALALDANLERVIARLFGLKSQKGVKLQKEIQALFLAKKIFATKDSPRALNEALMDLGRTICQARKASCELCVLKHDCLAFKEGNPLSYPFGFEKISISKKMDHELKLLRVFVIKRGKLLVYKKNEKEWLAGQFEVPTFVLKSTDPKFSQYPEIKYKLSKKSLLLKTGITKYSIENCLEVLGEEELKDLGFGRKTEWREIKTAESNFSTATLKGLKLLGLI
jgi:A/G-specific adenine glycosylase